MPERELSLEEFDSLFEEAPSTSEAKSPTQKALATAAQTKIGLPDIGAALGRPDLFGDLFRAATFPISEPINLMLGNKSFAEKLTSEQQTPSFQSLKGGDIGKAIPDVLQGALVGAGQAGGAALGGLATLPGGSTGAVPGAIAGGAAMSVPATKAASALREYSPEFFGENQNVNIAGIELSPEEFNLALDAVAPMAGVAGKMTIANLKPTIARKLVTKFGREAPDEIAKAYHYIRNPANLVDPNLIPEPTSGVFGGGAISDIEQISSAHALSKIHEENARKVRTYLMQQGGMSEDEMRDMAVPIGRIKEANALPQRRAAESFSYPTKTGQVFDPSTARGIQMASRAGRVQQGLKDGANARYQFVKDTLEQQGDTSVELNPAAIDNLNKVYTYVSGLTEEAPELVRYYGNIKSNLEDLLGLPHVTRSVTKKGDTIVKLEKTVETPKAIKTTTGETQTKATETGKKKEFVSETLKQGIGIEGAISAPKLANRTQGIQETFNIPEPSQISLPGAMDFSALVDLNHHLKRRISDGNLSPDDIPVLEATRNIEQSIKDSLARRPNGAMLLKKYEEGSNIVRQRHATFNSSTEKLIDGDLGHAWDKIYKDSAAANAFITAAGNRAIAQKEAAFNLINSATGIDGEFNARIAHAKWKDSPGIKEIFTKKQRESVEQFLNFASAVSPKISDIGKFAVGMRGMNLAINVGSNVLAGTPTRGGISQASLWFLGRAGLSKILLDPEAAKIATGLLKMPARSPRALGQIRRLLPYLNGTKVLVNVGNQSFETTVDSDLLSRVKFANEQQPNQTYDLLNRIQGVQ